MLAQRQFVVALGIAAAAPFLAGAAPSINAFSGIPVHAEATISAGPAISTPGNTVASGFAPAPVPNIDQRAPAVGISGQAQIQPKLFHKRNSLTGDGYVFGSTFQEEQERRSRPEPGVNVTMPLQ